MHRNCFLLTPDETTLSVVHRTLKMFRNSQSGPLWSKIDPLRAQIDPLWSQTRGTLARLQKQNTNKMSYSLEKSKKAVSSLRVVSSPEQYVCFFKFNCGLFSYLLSFSYRFCLPYFLDLANCVSDQAEFCSREGMRAIVKKYLYPVHKNKLELRDLFPIFLSPLPLPLASRKLFPYIPVLNLQFSLNFTECVKYKYRMKFIDVLETLCDKSQHYGELALDKGRWRS